MRLFKRAPATWAALAVITLAAELALRLVPRSARCWPKSSRRSSPAASSSRPPPPIAAHGRRSSTRRGRFALRRGAIAAIVVSALVTFAAEAFAAWWIAGANLLDPAGDAGRHRASVLIGIYAIGILASLPVMFVPFHVLLEPVAPGAAFAASWQRVRAQHDAALAYAARLAGAARLRPRDVRAGPRARACRCGLRRATPRGRTSSGFATRRRA